jgi:AraC-like DNA-binding protein
MDVHNVPGIKARDVAEAHRKDILLQEEHGCNCMTYWIDEERENVFCLIEAPAAKAVEELHNRAHGFTPHKIIEVNTNIVQSFLGRIYDPEDATFTSEGLKIFNDSSFRILLVTQAIDPVLLQYACGKEKANEILNLHNDVIRKNLSLYGGREVEHGGSGFIVSFTSAAKAVVCARAIQKELSGADAAAGLKIGIHASEPVATSDKLFGDAIQLARYMCSIARNCQVSITNAVRELVAKDFLSTPANDLVTLAPEDQSMLELLFGQLEKNWKEPEFDIVDYGKAMAMSKSQLYRKTIALTGLSPNTVLKEFRLEKAKAIMKKQRYKIAEITFDSGFTSPSYFTKCFKKKYGLLPMAYLDLLH